MSYSEENVLKDEEKYLKLIQEVNIVGLPPVVCDLFNHMRMMNSKYAMLLASMIRDNNTLESRIESLTECIDYPEELEDDLEKIKYLENKVRVYREEEKKRTFSYCFTDKELEKMEGNIFNLS